MSKLSEGLSTFMNFLMLTLIRMTEQVSKLINFFALHDVKPIFHINDRFFFYLEVISFHVGFVSLATASSILSNTLDFLFIGGTENIHSSIIWTRQ